MLGKCSGLLGTEMVNLGDRVSDLTHSYTLQNNESCWETQSGIKVHTNASDRFHQVSALCDGYELTSANISWCLFLLNAGREGTTGFIDISRTCGAQMEF